MSNQMDCEWMQLVLNNIEITLRRNFARLLKMIGQLGMVAIYIGILSTMIPAVVYCGICDFAKSICG